MPFGGMLTMGLISAGGSIASSALGGNKTTNAPAFSKDQKAMQSTVGGSLQDRLKQGGAGYYAVPKANAITSAITDTNAGFNGLQDSMQRGLIGRGFGSSGKVGLNTEKLGIARTGQIGRSVGDINSQYDQMTANYDQNTMNQAMQFAFASPGMSSTQGTPLGNGINAGLSTLTTLMTLHSMLNGGGGGGGFSGNGEPIGTMDNTLATSP